MVDEDIKGCAPLHQRLRSIFNFNIVLFLLAMYQLIFAANIMSEGNGSLGFLETLDENDTLIQFLLASGLIVAGTAFLGCCGAWMASKCILWMYAFVLFFMIMGQAMTVAVTSLLLKYGDAIFSSMWKELDDDTKENIEQIYQCCSFNGDTDNFEDTWEQDMVDFETCSDDSTYWEDIQSCWGKFEKTIDDNFFMVELVSSIFLGVQVVIYFATHNVIQSIAEAEGVEQETEMVMGGASRV